MSSLMIFILGALSGFAIGVAAIFFGYSVFVNLTEGRRDIDVKELRHRGL